MTEVDVLAVGAHPDDVELGCGGTILTLGRTGKRAGVVDLTRGELGTRGTPEQRAAEAEAAGRLMGLAFRLNLGLEDGAVRATQEARLELIEVIRGCRPRLIITHSPTGHPDHWEAWRLVREAAHHSGLAKVAAPGDRHRPDKLAFWIEYTQPQPPQAVVDISDVFRQKTELLRCYQSQMHRPDSSDLETYLSRPDFLDQITAQSRHFGNLTGCRFGEGFLLSRPARVNDLIDC